VRLHRAKAIYFRTLATESKERLQSLNSALAVARYGGPEWASTLIDLSEYYVEVSRYRKAIEAAEKVRAVLSLEAFAGKYECGTEVSIGVALFTSFRNLRKAEHCLVRASDQERGMDDDRDWVAWMARAYHYRGRIAEMKGDSRFALDLYMRGKQLQQRLPEDTVALGFMHLRIAELLAGQRLVNTAEAHLAVARKLFVDGSNQGSGLIQTDLGYAALCASRGQRREAEYIALRARKRCRSVGFWRGELLSLGYLLVLQLSDRRFGAAIKTCAAALPTLWKGELRRNNLGYLLVNMPVALSVAVRRMAYRGGGETSARVNACPCELHKNLQLGKAS
jgi:hypothetical protein